MRKQEIAHNEHLVEIQKSILHSSQIIYHIQNRLDAIDIFKSHLLQMHQNTSASAKGLFFSKRETPSKTARLLQ